MPEQNQINLTSIVKQGEDQVSTELDGEVVLMSIENGSYYSMDEVASRIWGLIETPRTVASVVDILIGEFAIERGECEVEVLDFLNKVAQERLIILSEDQVA